MVCISKPYPFKGYLPQNLLSSLLNTFSHMYVQSRTCVHWVKPIFKNAWVVFTLLFSAQIILKTYQILFFDVPYNTRRIKMEASKGSS